MSEHLGEAERILKEAERLHDADAVSAAYDRMAEEVSERLTGSDPVVMCAMMGGLVTTAELTRRLTLPFELDFLQATRYRGDTQGGEMLWKVSPSLVLEGRAVLVVDDILDEGHTLNAILESLRAQRPERIVTAVLVEKQHERRHPDIRADIVGLKVDDRYVFGCGMDYRGYWRQLPEIYAVPV